MEKDRADRWLNIFAVCFLILAISNALKPLQILGGQTGFVLFGQRLTGGANLAAGLSFAIFLAVYAYGVWQRRSFALPMAWIYAAYVLVNLAMFPFRTGAEQPGGVLPVIFGLIYAAIALGVSGGAAWLLTQRRDELR